MTEIPSDESLIVALMGDKEQPSKYVVAAALQRLLEQNNRFKNRLEMIPCTNDSATYRHHKDCDDCWPENIPGIGHNCPLCGGDGTQLAIVDRNNTEGTFDLDWPFKFYNQCEDDLNAENETLVQALIAAVGVIEAAKTHGFDSKEARNEELTSCLYELKGELPSMPNVGLKFHIRKEKQEPIKSICGQCGAQADESCDGEGLPNNNRLKFFHLGRGV